MKVPAFMLKKLYVPKSLTNTPEGATFRLKNTLATSTLTAAPKVWVDGAEVPASSLQFTDGSDKRGASEITPAAPIEFKKGVEVTILMRGKSIGPGKHAMKIEAESKEWQTLAFDIEETL